MASYSIGDVAEKCGINPVTLRAWQRRYGLLKPQRSEGGHRQFDEADIQRIEEIKRWIQSGVPVGKVKAILDKNEASASNGWSLQQEEMMGVLRRVRPDELRQKIADFDSQYEAGKLIDNVYIPVRQRLDLEQSTARIMCGLLDGVLIEFIAGQLALARKKTGKSAMLISWDNPDRTRLWLEAWRLSQDNWHIDVLAEPVEMPRPELFPALNVFLWTGKPLTLRQQELFEYWREQGYSLMCHAPERSDQPEVAKALL
ncbi:helix-turn-helix-type transcriptional regulator [Salmonella enterica subsp. enterica serovar Choleraesuis]|nr:helix-turn-helix-type transcriptional regulator [Salmonella enterica subsp. enterica serovar Choleraesuis]